MRVPSWWILVCWMRKRISRPLYCSISNNPNADQITEKTLRPQLLLPV
jgi:hypothetical protein